MNLRKKLTLLFLFLGFAGPVFAETNEVMLLKQQVLELTQRLTAMEQKLANVERSPAVSTYVVPAGDEYKGVSDFAKGLDIGGYVDAQYNQNFTNSGDVVAGANTGRIFDRHRDSFTLNAAEINLARKANPEGGAGFRVDVAYGEDSSVVNADGDGDTVNLQQAYGEYVAPLGFFEGHDIFPQTLNIKAGRFTTLAGAEVIEGPDNWNISRSYAFGLAIPFVHTGVRTNFGLFNNFFDTYLGINNGWDNPVDNNTYKTLESGLGYSPLKNVSLFHALYWGPENAATNGRRRFLLSNVAKWNATDKLSFMTEMNFGDQRRELTLADANVRWHSYNFYTRYQFNDKFALGYRGELFRDGQAFRSGLDTSLWEQTLTAEYALTEQMIARLEWRYDKADNLDAFDADESSQTILGAQLLYLI